MAQRNLNLGTPPAGTDGDTVRAAFEKVQANTTELYATKQDGIEGLTPAGISFLQAGDAADQREIIGLGNVDNTADADKPVSTAQQQAIDSREAVLVAGANISIDRTDPAAPVISSTGGGSGSAEWGAIGGNLEDQIDLQNALNGKVDTAPGMGLSEQDFTSELMMKLNEIEPMAQRNVSTNLAQGARSATEVVVTSSTGGGATLSAASTTFAGLMSAADKTRVDGIPSDTDGLSEGSTNLYFTAARVRSTLLTGLVAGTNAAIAATDTLLQALAKLQAQVTAKLTNPMTAPGDLVVGGASGAAQRLGLGAAGQALRVNAAGTGLEYTGAVLTVTEVGGTPTNGYRKYSDGTIEQWGSVSVPNLPVATGNLFSWNTPFLERVESFIAVPVGVGRSTQGEANNTFQAFSLSQFRISSGMGATPLSFNWFARGR